MDTAQEKRLDLSMDIVHGQIVRYDGHMRSVPISEFKQTCLRLLEEVRQTGRGFRITKRGVPIADVVPVQAKQERDWRGCMEGTVEFPGDVVGPATDEEDWEALKP